MSVPSSLRGEGQLVVITKTNALAEHTIKVCSNEKLFPKRYRWCITADIVKAAVDISGYTEMANSVFVNDASDYALRNQYQTKALATTYSLLNKIKLAYTVFGLESSKVEYWTGLILEVQNLLRKWRKSDNERYKNLG